MSAINDQVYARVHEKAKEHQLSEQEIHAIDTARQKLNSHTYLGGFSGASAAFIIGKRKNFKPLQLLAVAAGGFLMGSQVGMVSGALSGINVIKTLPDPQRLVNVIREVQKEALASNGKPGAIQPSTTTSPTYPSLSAASSSSQVNDSFSLEDPALHGEYTRSGSEFQTDRAVQHQQQHGWKTSDSNDQQQQQQLTTAPTLETRQSTQPSKWEQIRSENLPNSAWTRIRLEAAEQKTDAKSIEQARAQRVTLLKEREATFDDLPRTREETEQRTAGRRNQWGDMTE